MCKCASILQPWLHAGARSGRASTLSRPPPPPAPAPATVVAVAALRPPSAALLLTILLTVICTLAEGLTWDRQGEIPEVIGASAVRVPLSSESWYARSLRATNSTVIRNAADNLRDQSGDLSVVVLIGGYSADVGDTQAIWLFPYPFEASRSGQHRWIRAPIVGTQPRPRDTAAVTATSDARSPFAGLVWMFGGFFSDGLPVNLASLWALDLERTTWTPLGPSRLFDAAQPDAYTCDGKPRMFDDGLIQIPAGRQPSIDDCWFSSISAAQTDEFGCPWPNNRQGHAMMTIGDAIIVYAGNLMSRETVGDVWRLRMDNFLQAAIEQQATSLDGKYVYNHDQLLFLANSSNPTISRDRLCPVRWELLTRSDGSSSLQNQPASAPAPAARWLTTVTVQDSMMLVVGGQHNLASVSTYSDVWALDFGGTEFAWIQLNVAPRSVLSAPGDMLLPAARSFHGVAIVTLENLSEKAYDPSLPNLQACGTGNTTTIAVLAGEDTNGVFISAAHFLTPNCDGTSAASAPFASAAALASRTWSWSLASPSLWPTEFVTEGLLVNANVWLQVGTTMISVTGDAQTQHSRSTLVYDLAAGQAFVVPLAFRSIDIVSQSPLPLLPPKHSLHSAFLVGRLMYVVGSELDTDNQMWAYDVDRYQWSLIGSQVKLPSPGAWWPPSAQLSVYAHDESNMRIIQYGGGIGYSAALSAVGFFAEMNCTNQVFVYDLSNGIWSNVTSQLTSNTPWNDTVEAAQATGGEIINGYLYPIGRCAAGGVVLGSGESASLYIMSGVVGVISDDAPLDNALWKLNLTSLQWTLVQPTQQAATRPPGERLQSMVRLNDDQFVYAFGLITTESTEILTNIPWLYSASSNTWRTLPVGPQGRIDSPLASYGSDRIVVFGGTELGTAATNDCWMFDFVRMTWTQLVGDNTPVARTRHSLVASSLTGELFLYGGAVNDLAVHVLNLDEVTAGGQSVGTLFPHDWLACLQLNLAIAPLVPLVASTGILGTGVAPVPYAFATLAASIAYVQTSARSSISTITLLDHDGLGGASLRTSQFLSRVPITTQITIRGATQVHAAGVADADVAFAIDSVNTETLTTGAGTGRSLLLCDSVSSSSCPLLIGTPSDSTTASPTSAAALQVFLSDFTILGGTTNSKGGAMLVSNANVALVNMALVKCWSASFGGAIAMENSDVTIQSSLVVDNQASLIGGGIYSVNSQLTIMASLIVGNRIQADPFSVEYSTYGQGGALSALETSISIIDSFFRNNTARVGGGLYASTLQSEISTSFSSIGLRAPTFSLIDSSFEQNAASDAGGAVYLRRLTNNIDITGGDLPVLTNNTFTGNTASTAGALMLSGTQVIANDSSFMRNAAQLSGGQSTGSQVILTSPGRNSLSSIPTLAGATSCCSSHWKRVYRCSVSNW